MKIAASARKRDIIGTAGIELQGHKIIIKIYKSSDMNMYYLEFYYRILVFLIHGT